MTRLGTRTSPPLSFIILHIFFLSNFLSIPWKYKLYIDWNPVEIRFWAWLRYLVFIFSCSYFIIHYHSPLYSMFWVRVILFGEFQDIFRVYFFFFFFFFTSLHSPILLYLRSNPLNRYFPSSI